VDVGFLGPPTVVPGADGLPNPVEEAGPGRSGRACFAHDPRCECCRRVAQTGSGWPAHGASIIGLGVENPQDAARYTLSTRPRPAPAPTHVHWPTPSGDLTGPEQCTVAAWELLLSSQNSRAPTTVPLPARIPRRVAEADDIRRTDSRERADSGPAAGTPYELPNVASPGTTSSMSDTPSAHEPFAAVLNLFQTPPRRTRTEPPRWLPRGRSTSSRWRRRGVLDERFMCRASARMPAAIVHAIGTPTVARLHGRRYAPAPPRSGKHEVPQKGRASRLDTSRRRLALRVRWSFILLYPFFFPPLFPRSDRRPVAPVRHRARFDRAPPRLGHRRLGEPLAHRHGQRPLIDRLVGDLGMVSLSRQPGVKLRRRVCVSIATGEVSQDSFEPRCRPVSTCSGHHGDERGRLRDLGRCGCPDAVTD